ncbi:MAG: thioesterase family protein [Dehalococcoidia bacterium]
MAVKVNVFHDGLQKTIEYFIQKCSPSFNDILSFSIDSQDFDIGIINFSNRDELIGNPVQRILHGGVISSILDVAGGHTVFMQVYKDIMDEPLEKQAQILGKLGTIDLRIDYLRPGRGNAFTAKGYILRKGNKVAVTRMELHNEEDLLIAVGTGTYALG